MRPSLPYFVILAALSAASLTCTAQQVAPQPPTEVRYILECQTAFTNRSKAGFGLTNNPNCPDKIVWYRQQTITDDWETHASYYPDNHTIDGSYYNVSVEWGGSGMWTFYGGNSYWADIVDGTNGTPCTFSWTNITGPVTDPCGYFNQFDNMEFRAESWLLEQPDPCKYVFTNYSEGGGELSSGVQFGSAIYEYAQEYTTPELLSTNGFDYPGGEWSAGGEAWSYIDTRPSYIEDNAELQKARYRFKAIAPAGSYFVIPYYEHFKVDGSDEVITSHGALGCYGTGSWAYYPTNGPIEFAPPYAIQIQAGCTNYVGARRWITLGCSPDSSCAGGACPRTAGGVTAANYDYGPYIHGSLGRDSFGEGSGALILAGATPATALFTPAGLEYLGNLASPEIIRSPGGALRQVLAPQVFANIVTNSSTSYRIDFYAADEAGAKDQDGYHQPNGSPFTVATVSQGSTTNDLLLSVVNTTTAQTNLYAYTWSEPDQAWTLLSGGGLRKETRSWDPTGLARTNTIRNAANQIVYQEVNYFQNLGSLGNVLSRRVVAPQGPALTTRWFYCDNPANDGTNYGKLRMVIQPTGFWTAYTHDTNGWLAKEVSQFLNAPTNAAESQCRVVTYDYTPLATNCLSECRVETLLGQEVSRQYTLNYGSEIRTIRCQTPGTTNLNALDNLITVTWTYSAGSFVGKPMRTLNPDGTMEFYQYQTNSTQLITTVLSGQPDTNATTIVDGTQTVTVAGPGGATLSRVTTDIASTLMTSWETSTTDDLGRVTLTDDHMSGAQTTYTYACCGLESTTDREGTTYYTYDALNRQTGTTRNGITTTKVLDAADNELATIRTGTNSLQITLGQAAYDVSGRLTNEVNALDGTTAHAQTFDGSGQTLKTTTYPDGGTRVETYYQDGSLRSVTGTAVFPVRYEYGVESESGVQRAYTRETKLQTGGGDSGEWTKTYSDMLGRGYKTVYADAAASRSFYNNQGQLWKQVDPDGVTTLYQYNGKSEPEYTAIDMNTNGVIDFVGTDRITQTVSDVTYGHGCNLRRTRTYVWTTDSQGASLLINTSEISVGGLNTWNTSAGLTTSTTTTYPGSGVRLTQSYAPDGSRTVTTWQSGYLRSVVRYPYWGNTVSQTDYGYDPHGRQSQITDGRNGTTTLAYNDADLVQTLTTPVPAAGQPAQTTTTHYNKMLQATNVVQPDNTSMFTEYHPTGLPKKKYGSRQYPVEYTYDYAGRLKTMKTWADFAGNHGAAITTWNYNSARGWLDNKRYADNQGPSYTYTAAGRPRTRAWARSVTATYSYNHAGDLTAVAYSDTTPAVSFTFDRRGRQITAAQAGATTATRLHDDAGNLLSEAYSGGSLSGLVVTNTYDQYLRRSALSLLDAQSSILASTAYGYDGASRLQTVSDGVNSAAYTYLAYSPLVSQIDFAANSTPVMSTLKQYDFLNRLTNISMVNSAQEMLDSHAYVYNSANQRTAVTNADNSYWLYQYDALGQVISGRKHWSDDTPVAGQQFQYGFDDIGNRKTTAFGGDEDGVNLELASYNANSLNQYIQRAVPGYVSSLGTANSNATVSLWAADGSYGLGSRKGEYFRAELPVNNSTGAVWLTLTNLAVLTSGSNPDIVTSTVAHEFLPQTPEPFTHDADGNLTQDGRWIYTWDAENRLVTLAPSTAVGPQISLKFDYDSQGRRIRKQVWDNANWSGSPTNDLRFVYDGWNLIATLNSQLSTLNEFVWGGDLSGTMQGAGGVGGLLFIGNFVSPIGYYAPAYDGNGNVATLVSMSAGTNCAAYEYGPFGELLRATGPIAKANPLRFSSKYQDDETDLLYYGHRYYNATTGRWLSRDPIGEGGGRDLHGFVGNNPIIKIDKLGLCKDGFGWFEEEHAFPLTPEHPVPAGRVLFLMAPEASVVLHGCCYKVCLDGKAGTVVEYIPGIIWGEDVLTHERNHVDSHFKPAYYGYKGEAASLGGGCMTKARAACIRDAIASELKQEYEARAYRDAFSFDWYDYGWRLDPDDLTALWNSVQDWTTQYENARSAKDAAVSSCLQ